MHFERKTLHVFYTQYIPTQDISLYIDTLYFSIISKILRY